MRGPGAFSVYDNIPEKVLPEAIEKFALYDKLVEDLQGRADLDLAAALEAEALHAVQVAVAVTIPMYTTKRLTFCTHSYTHECFRMHGQETNVWCVVATGQMILDFWRYYYPQSDIATAMNTGPGGTGWAE
jgi:hypothetical protein